MFSQEKSGMLAFLARQFATIGVPEDMYFNS